MIKGLIDIIGFTFTDNNNNYNSNHIYKEQDDDRSVKL